MKTMLLLVSFALLGVTCVGSASAQETSAKETSAKETLRWKLQKGEKYDLLMKQQTNSVVTLSSKKLNSTVDLQVKVRWEVQSAEDEQFVIQQTVEAIRIDMKGPDQSTVVYDSADKQAIVVGAAKDLKDSVASLLGASFTMTLRSTGEIAAVPDNQAAGDKPSSDKPAGKNAADVSQLLRRPLVVFPQAIEEANPSWTDTRQTQSPLGDVTQKRTFTLAGTEDRAGKPAAKIEVKGELQVAADATTNPKGVPVLKQQSHTGTIWFANEAGRLIAAETNLRLVTESIYRDSAITVDLTTSLTTSLTPRD